jgi:hypothetical protein
MKIMRINFCLLMLALFVIGCGMSETIAPGRSLQDSLPPSFTDLDFPTESTVAPESALVITGTLVDTSDEGEPGFHPTNPVYIEIDTLGSDDQVLKTTMFSANQSDPDPTYFDFETGEFAMEFGTYRWFKPGNYDLRLYGVDASNNTSSPVEGSIIVTPIEGIDTQDLYDAREDYGNDVIEFLEGYQECLEVYGTTYEEDIAVISALIDYVDTAYVESPTIDMWPDAVDDLADEFENIDHSDYTVNVGLDLLIDYLGPRIDEFIDAEAKPFYPGPGYYDENDLVDMFDRAIDEYTLDIFVVDLEATLQNGVTGEFEYYSYDAILDEQIYPAADFIVTANPQSDLEITGTIGMYLRWSEIEENDYDPPVKLFGLFEGAMLTGDLLKH